jgi:hypothetical protein
VCFHVTRSAPLGEPGRGGASLCGDCHMDQRGAR